MAEDDKPLEPDDFPVRTEQKKILKNDGETIAEARNEKIADEVAERLNTEEQNSGRGSLVGLTDVPSVNFLRPESPSEPAWVLAE